MTAKKKTERNFSFWKITAVTSNQVSSRYLSKKWEYVQLLPRKALKISVKKYTAYQYKIKLADQNEMRSHSADLLK